MKHKKLDVYDRMTIQSCIAKNLNMSEIARRLKVNKSTISREIKTHSYHKGIKPLKCKNKTKTGLCNGCPITSRCEGLKTYYNYDFAQQSSSYIRTRSRYHSYIDRKYLKYVDNIFKEGVSLGHSIHHIYVSNSSLELVCSERTIRRWIYDGLLSVKPHELHRYVRYKHNSKKENFEAKTLKNARVFEGRTYKDYKKYLKEHPKASIVQYDSVIGKRSDKKAILTIMFVKEDFQIGRVIRSSNPIDVQKELSLLFNKFNKEEIKDMFEANLTDNGVEFSYFSDIEIDNDGEKVCSTFFANAYRATDKSKCERNHQFIRYVLPKSTSLNWITQEYLDELFSNINSYVRKSKGDKTPYELFVKRFGEGAAKRLGIRQIPKEKVRLKPVI